MIDWNEVELEHLFSSVLHKHENHRPRDKISWTQLIYFGTSIYIQYFGYMKEKLIIKMKLLVRLASVLAIFDGHER